VLIRADLVCAPDIDLARDPAGDRVHRSVNFGAGSPLGDLATLQDLGLARRTSGPGVRGNIDLAGMEFDASLPITDNA
jgi:hypothetical protein